MSAQEALDWAVGPGHSRPGEVVTAELFKRTVIVVAELRSGTEGRILFLSFSSSLKLQFGLDQWGTSE
jgi:hypothetical protein